MDNTKKNDRRISIVLNGKEKLYDELVKDKREYEELLNEEIAATQEKEDRAREFEWILPEPSSEDPSKKVVDLGERRKDKEKLLAPYWDDGKSDKSPKLPPNNRKKKRFDFRSLPLGMIGIVMSAIIVGVSFGFMMLTIFTGEKLETATANFPVQTPSSLEQPVALAPGQVPILGVEVVQGGAFSLVAKGQEVAEELQNKGFASALTKSTEPVFLFIGLGLDREQANVVAEEYKANGQEVYVKPYAVTTNGTVKTDEQGIFLETGVSLFEKLTLLSINGLAASGTLVNEENMNELATIYEKLVSIEAPFSDNDIQSERSLAFQSALTNAYQKMQSYSEGKDENILWQVQQYLLNGLIEYEELTKTFN
jgi:stage II sporulation protein B